ncbi:MAG: MmcQ/YjbR family DNA-binding protein [Rhizobiaceae bacterium]
MERPTFDAFCKTLPAAEMVVQWGGAHVWKVGGKIFAICGPWGKDSPDGSLKISFKASDMAFRMLIEEPGLIPAPYLGRYKWVQAQEAGALSDDDLRAYISEAHKIVVSKLLKKVRLELKLY